MSEPDAVPVSSRSATTGFVLLVGLLAIVGAAKAVLFDTLDPDCFWHLKVAEQLRADGVGPLIDKLSFASIQEAWSPYSWLAELAMKSIWDRGGFRAALAVQALMQAGFVVVAALACRAARPAAPLRSRFLPGSEVVLDERAASHLAAGIATAFCAFVSMPYLSFRPVTAALILLGICCWLLVRDRAIGEKSRAVWIVPLLTALMINLHLYAVFVPVWIAALWAGAFWERWRVVLPVEQPEADRRTARYLFLLVASAVACCATPMLPGVVDAAVHYQYDDPMVASGYLSEMWPFFRGTLGMASGVLVVIALGSIACNLRRMRPGEFLWVAGSLLILSRMGRFAPVFALATAPVLAAALPGLSDRVLAKRPVCAALASVLAIATLRTAIAFPSATQSMDTWLNRQLPYGRGYPCAAADWVDRNVPARRGKLISEFTWSGYLEWRLGHRYQLLLDGRTQLFAPEFWRAAYLNGPEPRQQLLSKVYADAAIVPLGTSLFRSSLVRLGWKSAWRDEQSEVLLPPSGQPLEDNAGGWSLFDLMTGR